VTTESNEKDADLQTLRDAAKWLQGVSEKCCECTDGHHDQQYAYGTENDVHISRDTARALASWLNTAAADLWAHGPLCCADGCDRCDDALWMPHVRRALAVARGVRTGHVFPPGVARDGGPS